MPTSKPFPQRSPVLAPHAMVASSQPLAVQVGVDILKAGGHAVDAAIAVNAMLGLVEPMSCGIGGDVFAIVWDAKERRLTGLNGSGRSPAAMTRTAIAERGHDRIPLRGPLSWTVPGCVDGWATLHERYGRLSFGDLLAPTIGYADGGFPVTPVIAAMWERAEALLAKDPGSAEGFLINGHAPRSGDVVRNPGLADTLRSLANSGRDGFYQGAIAERIVACSSEVGGFLQMDDLAAHTSTWVDPVSISYRGWDIWELPPNTQGIAALQMLALLEGFDLSEYEHNSPELLHLLIEAKKLAYEDRAHFYADPAHANVPIQTLISKSYADDQRKRLTLDRAALDFEHGDPKLRMGDTVYLTVVDEQRNAVSFIQSIYHGFGSGITPRGLGFVLQNRGHLFHLDPNHANSLEPGKRPFHTIIPGFVTRDADPVYSFGVMGGDMQPQGHVQVLVNLLDFGMDPQAAGDAIRFRHDGSSTPTGDVMVDGGTVHLEPGFSEETIAALEAKGHRIRVEDAGFGGFGGYQGIWIDPETGMLHGGTERRKDGCAAGY